MVSFLLRMSGTLFRGKAALSPLSLDFFPPKVITHLRALHTDKKEKGEKAKNPSFPERRIRSDYASLSFGKLYFNSPIYTIPNQCLLRDILLK